MNWYHKKESKGQINYKDMKGVIKFDEGIHYNYHLDPQIIPQIKEDYDAQSSTVGCAANISDKITDNLNYSDQKKDFFEHQRYHEDGPGHIHEDDLDSSDNLNIAVAHLNSIANKFLNKYAKNKV